MNKVLAAIVASTFALGSVAGYAADSAKKEELTTEQRTEMRDRAGRLNADRAAAPATPAKTATASATKVKKNPVKKGKTSRNHTKKSRSKA